MMVNGDARRLPLAAGSCQMCVTSPPYWGLRDYGTATWEGGEAGCDHRSGGGRGGSGSPGKQTPGSTNLTSPARGGDVSECVMCGARRLDRQLGLESTPDLYVASMVGVFREVWRVLADDGVLFCNLGDSYATGAGSVGACPGGGTQGANWKGAMTQPNRMPLPGLKPKDLVGIPWRVAFALQADGWYLRSDIIWAKPNPMPESVRDRPTKSHEYIFLLTKRAKYYWDADAIRENPRMTQAQACENAVFEMSKKQQERAAIAHDVWGSNQQSKPLHSMFQGYKEVKGANCRSVWTIATQPYPEAHFATFPEKLVEPCIKAGSRPGDRVLDPFGGSGTVGRVALRLNRRPVLVELNPAYLGLAQRRVSHVQPSLLEAV